MWEPPLRGDDPPIGARKGPSHILLRRSVNLEQAEHRDEKSNDGHRGRSEDSSRNRVLLVLSIRKGRGVSEICGLLAHLARPRLNLSGSRQWLSLARGIRFVAGLYLAKTNAVADPQENIRDYLAVDAGPVRRPEVPELVTIVDQRKLRMTSGDRRIFDLDHVVRCAADRDTIICQLVAGFRTFQQDG